MGVLPSTSSRWRRWPPAAAFLLLVLRQVRWLVQLHHIGHICAALPLPLLRRRQQRCSSLGGPQPMLPRCWRHPGSLLPAAGNAGWLLQLLLLLLWMLLLWMLWMLWMLLLLLLWMLRLPRRLLPRLLPLLSMLLGHAAPLGSASSGRSSSRGGVRLQGVGMQSACRHGQADDAGRLATTAGNATAQQTDTAPKQYRPLSWWPYHRRCPVQCLGLARHPDEPGPGPLQPLLAPAAPAAAPAAAAACLAQAPAPASASCSSPPRCWRRTLQQRAGRQAGR